MQINTPYNSITTVQNIIDILTNYMEKKKWSIVEEYGHYQYEVAKCYSHSISSVLLHCFCNHYFCNDKHSNHRATHLEFCKYENFYRMLGYLQEGDLVNAKNCYNGNLKVLTSVEFSKPADFINQSFEQAIENLKLNFEKMLAE